MAIVDSAGRLFIFPEAVDPALDPQPKYRGFNDSHLMNLLRKTLSQSRDGWRILRAADWLLHAETSLARYHRRIPYTSFASMVLTDAAS